VLPVRFVCCHFTPPEGWKSPDGLWSKILHYASQDSNQFPVLGHTECRGGDKF
jgi:hypothetical protein